MVSITQDFAPPFKLVAPYFIIGVIFYLISNFFVFNLNINELSVHSLDLISFTHLFLLGFVMMIIFGAMAQLIPVTLEVGHFSVEFYYIIYPLLLIGTILMAIGFSWNTSVLPYGGLLVFLSMIIFLVEAFLTTKKVTNFSNIVKSIIVSNFFLFIGIVFGILMALTYAGQITLDVQKLSIAHVFSLIFGYIMITIMALSMVLIPMFGLSHNFSQKPLNNAVKLLSVSTILVIIASLFELEIIKKLAYIGSIASLFIYFYQIYLIYKTRARKEIDIYYKFLFVAFVSFILSLLLGLLYIFIEKEAILFASAWLLISGFFAFLIIGHIYKIVPFLVWFEKFSPLVGKEKVPLLTDMIPKKSADFQFLFALMGIIISTIGLVFSSDIVFKAGISFISISAIFLIKNLFYMIRFK